MPTNDSVPKTSKIAIVTGGSRGLGYRGAGVVRPAPRLVA